MNAPKIYTRLTHTTRVRQGFTQESDWRDALGGAEPLHLFVADGPLDAPNWMPAGSTVHHGKYGGVYATTTTRADFFD